MRVCQPKFKLRMSHFWYRFAYCVTRISTAFSCILLLCIYSQTSKIHSGSGGGQRTKTVSSFYSLEFSTTSSHAGEIGSDVISEKSLPFERQTQRVSPPLPGLLALSHLFLCCLPIGPANGNKSLSQITISSHGLDSYIQSFFHPYLDFFPFLQKAIEKPENLCESSKEDFCRFI